MKIHNSITVKLLMEACEARITGLDNPGFCIACGESHDDCEPDAREYRCEECGKLSVYGAEELLLMVV